MNVPVQPPSPILAEVVDERDRFIALRRDESAELRIATKADPA
jgi:hypothetical protein